MKKLVLLALVLLAAAWVVVACSNSTSSTGSTTSNPTATPTSGSNSGVGATVSYGGNFNFSPSAVTITHGQSVAWDSSLSGHNVTVDNFSGTSGTCGSPYTSNSFPQTVNFPTTGTYYYHCGINTHSACTSIQCGTCATTSGQTSGLGNMVGSVVVN